MCTELHYAISHDAPWRPYRMVPLIFSGKNQLAMADAAATALNSMCRSVQLSPRDEESVQAFIEEFFASSDSPDSDYNLSGIMNFNNK